MPLPLSKFLAGALSCSLILTAGQLQAEEPPAQDVKAIYEAAEAQLQKDMAATEADHQKLLETIRALRRDADLYEMDFAPLRFDQMVLRDPMGETRVFHYMIFRIRNVVADSQDFLTKRHSRYNEVLDGIITAYEGKLKKDVSGGGSLIVTDADKIADPNLSTVVAIKTLKVQNRRLRLTAIAVDELGTRFKALNPIPHTEADPVKAGTAPFNFEDRGKVGVAESYDLIHKAVEEAAKQRLFTLGELAQFEIPPYDPQKPTTFKTPDGKEDGFGMRQGEAYGVVVFSQLNPLAHTFSIRLNGCSNKQRVIVPVTKVGGVPDLANSDWYDIRVLRRTMTLQYSRSGDEFYRQNDTFALDQYGYTWVDTFQPLELREHQTICRRVLKNIRLPKSVPAKIEAEAYDATGAKTTQQVDVERFVDEDVLAKFKTHYDDFKKSVAERYDQRIASLETQKAEIAKRYADPQDTYQKDQKEAWDAMIAVVQRRMNERKAAAIGQFPDLKKMLETK